MTGAIQPQLNMLNIVTLLLTAILVLSSNMSPRPVAALTAAEEKEFMARSHLERNTQLEGSVSVVNQPDTDDYILTSNGIPDHHTGTFPGRGNPNDIKQQTFRFMIPKRPDKAGEPSCLTLGPIAFSKNGIPLFSPSNRDGENAVEGPTAETFDSCDGHPDQRGVYHYHQTPDCLYTGAQDEFIGVALDGFPIYGIMDGSGKNLTSHDLDACHGHMYNGEYMYRLTRDYPYVLGCFMGTVRHAARPGRPPRLDCIHTSGATTNTQGSNIYFLMALFVILMV